jgi:hypothetical protein
VTFFVRFVTGPNFSQADKTNQFFSGPYLLRKTQPASSAVTGHSFTQADKADAISPGVHKLRKNSVVAGFVIRA